MTDFNQFNKFTKEAKGPLLLLKEKAREAKLSYVGTEHLLISILSQRILSRLLFCSISGVSLIMYICFKDR